MALNFPDTPTIGQTFPQPPVSGMPIYTWDGEKWTSAAGGNIGGATILTGDTPPVGAGDNTLWLETDTGILFFKWNDGNSSQWVALASGTSGAVLYSNPQTLTAPQKSQARANISAASLEALADQNLIINGSMAISQELTLGGVGGFSTATAKYACDGWMVSTNYAGSVTVYYGTEVGVGGGFAANCVLSVSAASAATATSYFGIMQQVEGNRWARLNWGTSNAQPISVGFWASSEQVSGVATFAVRNNAGNRSYCVPFNLSTTGTYFTFTIPGCTDGTWPRDNTTGMNILVMSQVGSNFKAPTANAWVTGNYFGAPTQGDLHSAGANAIRIWGVTVIPGTIPVPQELAPFAMRLYDQELALCQRYYEKTYPLADQPGKSYPNPNGGGSLPQIVWSGGFAYAGSVWHYKARKRVAPTVTSYSPVTGAVGKVRISGQAVDANGLADFIGEYSVYIETNNYACPMGDTITFHAVADARL
jgi:hypothetical protein